jgi:hypothetical protein
MTFLVVLLLAQLAPALPSSVPAGYTVVGTHSCTQRQEAGFTVRNDPNFALVQDTTRGSVCQATFLSGKKGGVGPVQAERTVSGSGGLYVGTWIYVSPNWQGHKTGTNKVFHLWINGSNRVVLKLTGARHEPLRVGYSMQNVIGGSTPNTAGTGVMPRGRWVHWETIVTLSSVTMYLDGSLVLQRTGLNWLPSLTPHWDKVSWNPTWGGVGDQLLATQTMRLDDLTVAVQ